jgi:sterol desaturase/sphingolipid hydroxylase (fatty acid hydroxylase superfamily)
MTPSFLSQLFMLTPLLPWSVACVAAMGAEHATGSSVRWEDRRLNLVAGAWVLLTVAVTQVLLVVALTLIHQATHTVQAPWALDQGYPGAAIVGVLVWIILHDTAYYIFHRAQHSVPWLWRFHAIHHSDPTMNATTYARQHVLENVLQSAFILLPMLLLFRLSSTTVLAIGLISAALQFWIHADVPVHYGPFSLMLASPLQHRWHHTRNAQDGETNFAGVFPWIDAIFGTYRAPDPHIRITTGLFDGTTWTDIAGLLGASPRARRAIQKDDVSSANVTL